MISRRAGKHHHDYLTLYGKLAMKLVFFITFLMLLFHLVGQCKTYFPIKSVKVFGASHIDHQDMQKELMPFVAKGFFAIDVESIKDRLLQSPWVSKAIVQRVWPSQVLITVVEKKPLARWNSSSLLSTNGEIFSPNVDSYPDGLPKFIGPDGQHIQMIQFYKKLSAILLPLHFKIACLELAPERTWRLTTDNGMKISVGYKDVLTRVNHFVKVYPKIVGDRYADIEYIDLRYSNNGLAVKWKAVT